MKDSVLIPEDRINVLTREVLKKIEGQIKVKITLDGNVVEIENDGFDVFIAKNVVRAVGRGFSPKNAFKLFGEENQIEVIALAGSEKNITRIKSRIIGTKGKTRRLIERYTECVLSVYGKTVSIIGGVEKIKVARKAVEMIIEGAPHSAVYKHLEKSQ